jgi:hypothetical protein
MICSKGFGAVPGVWKAASFVFPFSGPGGSLLFFVPCHRPFPLFIVIGGLQSTQLDLQPLKHAWVVVKFKIPELYKALLCVLCKP